MALLIGIDKTLKRPIFRQIIDNIAAMVDSRALSPGDKLPAGRVLARQLGVNRSTVSRAYEELWSLGYLESRPGSYSYIRARPGGPNKEVQDQDPELRFELNPVSEKLLKATRKEQDLLVRAARPGVINFIPLSPDPALIPKEDFRRSMNRALAEGGVELLQYGRPLGFEPLRRTIARRMRLHGVNIGAEEVLITAGAQQALDLICKLLAGPDRPVVVEVPTYSRAIDLFRLAGLGILEAPISGFAAQSVGLDLDALASLIKARAPAFIYTIPNFQNPTGLTTGQAHRERLLEMCKSAAIPLIEDGFEEEMKYFGKVAQPIKSMDRNGVVIYLGTFSKVLFPGLRIGWVAASKDLIARLGSINQATIISSSLPGQAAVENFCRRGLLESHLRRMHRVYRGRMTATLEALETNLDQTLISWTRPAGGYVIWLELKDHKNLTEDRLIEGLLRQGIAVMPGSPHFISPPPGLFFRLSIAHLDEAAITRGIKRLAKGLTALCR